MYRNEFGVYSERLFSEEFAVQIFMDLFLCSTDSSGNSYHAINSRLRLKEEVAKSYCLFSRVAFCIEICFATICKNTRLSWEEKSGFFRILWGKKSGKNPPRKLNISMFVRMNITL